MTRLIVAQIDAWAGAVERNRRRIAGIVATHHEADVVVFPEMVLSGYPIGDLVHRPELLESCRRALEALAAEFADGPAVILGCPWEDDDRSAHRHRVVGAGDKPIYNAAMLLEGGQVQWIGSKYHLPNEGIFDEQRNFSPAQHIGGPVSVGGVRLGVLICHDVWFSDVAETLQESGADSLVVLNASPFEQDGKVERRLQAVLGRVVETGLPTVTVNLVGGQDGVVFDGQSLVINADHRLEYQAPAFGEAVVGLTWSDGGWRVDEDVPTGGHDSEEEAIYRAIFLGLRDFVVKNGFEKVLLGLSGGVDSALVATLAVDALGAEQVRCVMLPSPHTSAESLAAASDLAERLGVAYSSLGIEPLMQAFDETLGQRGERPHGVVAENLQARIRGSLLMALSNQEGALLLTTGNKSEIAVGYCTLYGDMGGGFNPMADLYKGEVYRLCRWRNGCEGFGGLLPTPIIPEDILERAPSAELAPGQKDSDSLPDYAILDRLLYGLIEQNKDVATLVEEGADREMVVRILGMVDRAQHKRVQAAIGVKLSSCTLKSQWRYPITQSSSGEVS